jgi:hypothetical protein
MGTVTSTPTLIEKISIVTTVLESQVIENVEGYSEGMKFKSTWDDIDQERIKAKLMKLIDEI